MKPIRCPACAGERFFQTGVRVDLGVGDDLPVQCSVCLDCGNVLFRVSGQGLEHLNLRAMAIDEARRQKPSKEDFREL